MKKNMLELIANLSRKAAINAAGTASQFCFHQAKEPEALRKSK